MSGTIVNLDPDWAWAPYQPAAQQPWDRSRAAHLFRRAGFGATHAELQSALNLSPAEVVTQLLNNDQESPEYQAEQQQLARAALATGNPRQLSVWWLHRLTTSPHPLREKMTLFWHGHFATSAEKVTEPGLMYQQNELLRQHALGNFRELAQAVAKDPAMLIYLDSVSNRKAHPNENFARELMELFCLGEGEYTERDIRELARCFTGWEIRQERYRFNAFQHDSGEKEVLSRSGIHTGEEGVEVVVSQAACPLFLCRKLAQHYIMDEPFLPDHLLAPLADELQANQLELLPTIQRLLNSNLFFSDWSVGRKIRSPVELAVGWLRALEASTNLFDLQEGLRGLGQELFFPPNVKGWDGGRTWINSSTLLGRANLIRRLVDHPATRFRKKSLREFFESLGGTSGATTVSALVELLFSVAPSPVTQAEIAALLDAGIGDRNDRCRDALHWLCSLPEFQLV